jgi:hypothetical protein
LDELERFNSAYRALPITEALPIKALLIKALLIKALPVDTNTNEPAILVETNKSAVPVNINEYNQLAVPSANATEPLISTLETDEPAIPFANTIEPLVEDALTLNTLTLPPSPLYSIPATGFGQLHTLQRTNKSITPTYTSAAPTFTKFGRFQALQQTGVD